MIRGIIFILFVLCSLDIIAQDQWKMKPVPLQTRWAKEVSPSNALNEYPRPQLSRPTWKNLNGLWQYVVRSKDSAAPTVYDGYILVPFPIESALSGVKKQVLPSEILWYKRNIDKPNLKPGEKVLLHLGAVDCQATIYINSKKVGDHSGGYESFSFDITNVLLEGKNELIIKVADSTDQGIYPHGKQVLNPKDIYYTPSTGIWQTVWMEVVPEVSFSRIKMTPDIDRGQLALEVELLGDDEHDTSIYSIHTFVNGQPKGKEYDKTDVSHSLLIQIPKPHLWSPENPYLYDLRLKLYKNGKLVDEVGSYFGMRKVEVKKDPHGFERIFLNNNYTYNLGTLDQGFWPDGLYTAPTDEALSFDIKVIKAMGFNTIRKHIKIEPDRWYYHCDRIGMLVWQDFVNPPYNLPEGAKDQFERQAASTMVQLSNHPCITTWVLFNEKWGSYDQQRLTQWIKRTDPTRLVNGHSGEMLYVNEHLRSPSPNAWISSDMTDVHSYPDPMNAPAQPGKARVLGEFGGIGVFIPEHQWNPDNAWGYVQVTPGALKGKYAVMNQHLQLLEREGLSGSIYTQPFDVEGEQNGLLTYDREVIKIPLQELREIHTRLIRQSQNVPQVSVHDADVTDPNTIYSGLLQEYLDGNKEKHFLRKLGMYAKQVNDKTGFREATKAYIDGLKKPYLAEDLRYIITATNSTRDPGFAIIIEQAEMIDKLFGNRQAENKIMALIYQDELHMAVSGPDADPDWNQLASNVKQYGVAGEEIFLRAKTIHFLNRKDWLHFAKAGSEYISKFGEHLSPEELNQFAWSAFENVTDSNYLKYALNWSALTLKSGTEPAYLDTYANILYKIGNRDEAIKFQEKAVKLSNDAAIRENLEKMRRGEKTWE